MPPVPLARCALLLFTRCSVVLSVIGIRAGKTCSLASCPQSGSGRCVFACISALLLSLLLVTRCSVCSQSLHHRTQRPRELRRREQNRASPGKLGLWAQPRRKSTRVLTSPSSTASFFFFWMPVQCRHHHLTHTQNVSRSHARAFRNETMRCS